MKIRRNYSKYRWFVWGVLAFLYLVSIFHRMAVGAIQGDLTAEFHLSATQLATVSTIYFYIYMVMQIPVGMISDLFGVRKAVTVGAVVAGIGSVLFGAANTLAGVYIGRFLVGLGMSFTYIPLLTLQSRWFRAGEFGTMMGLTGLVGNLGAALSQTPLVLMAAYFTWRGTFVGLGCITVLIAIICFLVLRDRPEELGFEAVSVSVPRQRKKGSLKALVAVLKNPHSWPPIVVCTAVYGTQFTLAGTFGQRYFISSVPGCTEVTASNYTLLCALAFAFGSMVFNWLSDKTRRRRPFAIVMAVGNLAAWVVLALCGNKLSSGIIAAVVCCIGLTCSVVPLSYSLIKENNSSEYVGISTSTINFFTSAGGALMPMLVGGVLDRLSITFSGQALYGRAFIILIVVSAASAILSFFIRETYCEGRC